MEHLLDKERNRNPHRPLRCLAAVAAVTAADAVLVLGAVRGCHRGVGIIAADERRASLRWIWTVTAATGRSRARCASASPAESRSRDGALPAGDGTTISITLYGLTDLDRGAPSERQARAKKKAVTQYGEHTCNDRRFKTAPSPDQHMPPQFMPPEHRSLYAHYSQG